jgi:putative DNA methylase
MHSALQNANAPENVPGPTAEAWHAINAHLGTKAQNISELVAELGQRQFGHIPRVGDSFCGGGSIPFEAARIGCEAFGSDLNPVAALLTWAGLHLLGGDETIQNEARRVQEEVLAAADKQIIEWGIEHNERSERADAFLYCVEVKPEGSEYYIPLAPSWLIGEKSKVIARWHRVAGTDRLQPEIAVVDDAELKLYKEKKGATVDDSRVIDPFNPDRSWSVEALRGADGLRRWTNDDIVPRPGDVFQERLYCIRWIDAEGNRRYAAPDAADLAREQKVLELLDKHFADWQSKGYVPEKKIESGYNTDQPIRERGWTHWHHLFTPRQLLVHGLVAKLSQELAQTPEAKVACMLGLGRMADWSSRLSAWMPHAGNEKGNQVFYNQALNCHFNYSTRPFLKLIETFPLDFGHSARAVGTSEVAQSDGRDVKAPADIWLTDPPYADAINYHELSDFFLAWYDRDLSRNFPNWLPDARSALAVRGSGDDFRHAMVDIYRNLAKNMPDNGMQMVMFTHQDPSVWADLGMILWAAGLKATAAWTISTETEASGLKKGNYVQGTVCLVLRKRTSSEPGFLDDLYPLVEDEVKRQIASMQALDETGEPNFNDADYQLAAYAAALKVLTQYGKIEGKDVEHELFAVRDKNQKSDFEIVIERAIKIAGDILIPRGLEGAWRDLSLVERYFLRALDIESRGERRTGMYEELARGFGVTDIKPLLKSDKANGARMFTPTGFAAKLLAPPEGAHSDSAALPNLKAAKGKQLHPFATSALRHLMFAVAETAKGDDNTETGRQYLRDTFGQDYWGKRDRFVSLLDWLSKLGDTEGMAEWGADSAAARLLAGRLRNDHA